MEKCAVFEILVLLENLRKAPLTRVVEGERKRRILAVFAARWLEKDEKRDSFWRILGADILCTTSDLRGVSEK